MHECATENFINKAVKIHGNRYDYSKVSYQKAKTKVCIVCPEHGEFWQTPSKHLQGSGCMACGHASRKQTNLERYGNACSLMNDDVKAKARQTVLARYGTDHVMKCSEVKQRQEQTMTERYGVKNPGMSDLFQEKLRKTSREKYGTDYPCQSEIVKAKMHDSCMTHYGVGNPMQSSVVRSIYENTLVQHYGVTNPMQSDELKARMCKTNMERYGAAYIGSSDAIQRKIADTNMQRYGVRSPLSNPDVRARMCATNQTRYGGNSPICDADVRAGVISTIQSRYGADNVSKLDFVKDRIRETKRERNTFHTSAPEDMMYQSLSERFGKDDVLRQYSQDERYPFACDFYIRSLDLFIELNASWTHGGKFFDENDPADLDKLALWREKAVTSKFYKTAIETWTVRDVKKLGTVLKNDLNFLAFWKSDLSDFHEWFDGI